MACPLCFAEAGPGFSLTLEEVEEILDHLVETEGNPEVVQFSGGEPSIHPQIVPDPSPGAQSEASLCQDPVLGRARLTEA